LYTLHVVIVLFTLLEFWHSFTPFAIKAAKENNENIDWVI
jgi:hypothetical protein